jgi:hypothetical protein
VLLQQPHAEQLFDHGAEGDPGVTEQSGGEFGVEQSPGNQSDLIQTRQVLAGRMDDPLGLRNRGTKGRQVGRLTERGRINQMCPRPTTA